MSFVDSIHAPMPLTVTMDGSAVTVACSDLISTAMTIANTDCVLTTANSSSNTISISPLENSNASQMNAIKWSDVLEETEIDSDSCCSSPVEAKDDVSRLIGNIVDLVEDDGQHIHTFCTTAPSTYNSKITLNLDAVTSSSINYDVASVDHHNSNAVHFGTTPASNANSCFATVNLGAYGVTGPMRKIKLNSRPTTSTTTICDVFSSTTSNNVLPSSCDASTADEEVLVIILKRKPGQGIDTIQQNVTTPLTFKADVASTQILKDFTSDVTSSDLQRQKEMEKTGKTFLSRQEDQRCHECPTCGKTSFEKRGRTHAEKKVKYDCFMCKLVFSTFKDLKRHQEGESYVCSVCGNSNSLSYQQEHVKIHKKQKQQSACPPCGKVFSSSKDLEEHRQTHGKPYECLMCGNTYSRSSYLQTHIRSHTRGRPYTCEICGKSFVSKAYLTRHMNHHENQKRHRCLTCGKEFYAKSTLTCHLRTHTGMKPYACHICGKSFACKGNQSKHMKIHAGERTHQCSTCGKAFVQPQYLKVHMKTHTGEKPYECAYCGQAFSTKSILTCHTRTHTGEKPFACSICGKAFTKSSDLQTHLRRHRGEKPYSCSTCGKTFACSTSLNMHKRIHTGEKPYKCLDCGKCFISSSNLDVHKRIHSGIKPFKCITCEKSFIDKGHLLRHTKTHERIRGK